MKSKKDTLSYKYINFDIMPYHKIVEFLEERNLINEAYTAYRDNKNKGSIQINDYQRNTYFVITNKTLYGTLEYDWTGR